MTKQDVLKQYFGYDTFRGGQEEIIDALLAGRDVLAVMPTGAGKSVCYQVPALLLPGITLVVSPLVSLMRDQVTQLVQMGVPAAYLNSSLTYRQYLLALDRAREGRYKIIYVAPERLDTEGFQSFVRSAQISMVAVDEAHCISQWGQDIQRLLELEAPLSITTGFDRDNLYLEVCHPSVKRVELLARVRERPGECGIVYCSTRKNVEEVCQFLQSSGISATRYHAGLEPEERQQNQEDFLFDRVQVMVATNAFGMGIDKSDVRFVIHYNMPKDLESYYQEAGRAGRDGAEARCILLYSGQDVRTAQFLISQSEPSEQLDPETARQLQERDLGRLKQMTFYCRTRRCLRQYILNYFGQSAPDYCGACYNCLHNFQEIDVGEDARAILRCVAETGPRFGAGLIAAVLCGGENEKIRRYRLERERTYGALAALSQREVQDRIRFLVDEHILELTDGQYPVLRCGERAEDVAYSDGPLMMKAVREERPAADRRRAEDSPLTERQQALFQRLREERAHLARLRGVPAFVIFSDKTLREMAAAQPRDLRQLQNVGGVGSFKAEQYGAQFLEIISDFQETAAI